MVGDARLNGGNTFEESLRLRDPVNIRLKSIRIYPASPTAGRVISTTVRRAVSSQHYGAGRRRQAGSSRRRPYRAHDRALADSP